MIRSLNSHLILWYAILGPQILTNIFKLNWTCSFLRISCQMWIGAVPWIVHITSYSLFTWNLGCYIRMIFMDLLQSHRACKGITWNKSWWATIISLLLLICQVRVFALHLQRKGCPLYHIWWILHRILRIINGCGQQGCLFWAISIWNTNFYNWLLLLLFSIWKLRFIHGNKILKHSLYW